MPLKNLACLLINRNAAFVGRAVTDRFSSNLNGANVGLRGPCEDNRLGHVFGQDIPAADVVETIGRDRDVFQFFGKQILFAAGRFR